MKWLELIALSIIVIRIPAWTNTKVRDGWNFDPHTSNLFLISAILTLLISGPWQDNFIRFFSSVDTYYFSKTILTLSFLWSLNSILLNLQFNDTSAIEWKNAGAGKTLKLHLSRCANLSYIAAMFIFSIKKDYEIITLQKISLACAILFTFLYIDWRRALRRSSFKSNLYIFSLLLLSSSKVLLSTENFSLQIISYFCLFCGMIRVYQQIQSVREAKDFFDDFRSAIQSDEKSEMQLHKLCSLFQEEWNLARVSVVAVHQNQGLLLASSGPSAIFLDEQYASKSLGPFLRRICRDKKIRYAPSAEELGKDLLNQGMRHSSLAIPFLRNNEVIVVLCLMAEEDMRIAPDDAYLINLCCEHLNEILILLVQLNLQEDKFNRILQITDKTNGPLLENKDQWGRIIVPTKKPERRLMIRADIHLQVPAFTHSALDNLTHNFQTELHAYWSSLRAVFEFLCVDGHDTGFWFISPLDFQSETLKSLGVEQASLYLLHLMEKYLYFVQHKESYLALNPKWGNLILSAGEMSTNNFKRITEINKKIRESSCVVDCSDERLRDALDSALFKSGPVIASLAAGNKKIPLLNDASEIRSLINISTDKKELRKLESAALELARENLKKKAA